MAVDGTLDRCRRRDNRDNCRRVVTMAHRKNTENKTSTKNDDTAMGLARSVGVGIFGSLLALYEELLT